MNLIFLCVPYSDWRFGVVSIVGALLFITAPATMFLLNDVLHILPAFENMTVLIIEGGITLVVAVAIHVGIRLISAKQRSAGGKV